MRIGYDNTKKKSDETIWVVQLFVFVEQPVKHKWSPPEIPQSPNFFRSFKSVNLMVKIEFNEQIISKMTDKWHLDAEQEHMYSTVFGQIGFSLSLAFSS